MSDCFWYLFESCLLPDWKATVCFLNYCKLWTVIWHITEFCGTFCLRCRSTFVHMSQPLFSPCVRSHCKALKCSMGGHKEPPSTLWPSSQHSKGPDKWSWLVRLIKGPIIWFGLKIWCPLQLHWSLVRDTFSLLLCWSSWMNLMKLITRGSFRLVSIVE